LRGGIFFAGRHVQPNFPAGSITILKRLYAAIDAEVEADEKSYVQIWHPRDDGRRCDHPEDQSGLNEGAV
jgi:hypothetical protein